MNCFNEGIYQQAPFFTHTHIFHWSSIRNSVTWTIETELSFMKYEINYRKLRYTLRTLKSERFSVFIVLWNNINQYWIPGISHKNSIHTIFFSLTKSFTKTLWFVLSLYIITNYILCYLDYNRYTTIDSHSEWIDWKYSQLKIKCIRICNALKCIRPLGLRDECANCAIL